MMKKTQKYCWQKKNCEISGKITRQDAEKVKENLVVVGKERWGSVFSVQWVVVRSLFAKNCDFCSRSVCRARRRKGRGEFLFSKEEGFLNQQTKIRRTTPNSNHKTKTNLTVFDLWTFGLCNSNKLFFVGMLCGKNCRLFSPCWTVFMSFS